MVTIANIKSFAKAIYHSPDQQESIQNEIRLYRAVLKAIVSRNCADPHAVAAAALETKSVYDYPLRLEDWE